MPLLAPGSRSELRQVWCSAWRRHRRGLPLEPLQAQLVDVVAEHPEYQPALEAEDALERDWTAEAGEANPFLHLGLHVAVREGVATDRPAGIRLVYQQLLARHGSRHDAEHVLLDCLAETLWEAERAGRAPRDEDYLDRGRRLAARW